MKRRILLMAAAVTAIGMVFAGCGKNSDEITAVAREEGSGTRGAFVELFGIQEKNEAGEKIDMTTEEAKTTNSTSVMMTTVAGDKNAVGYVSLGTLQDTVKGVKIDGAEATAENVKNGSYKISRPFNIVYKDGLSDAAQDFVDFIFSEEGQKIVADNGYIPLEATGAFSSKLPGGKIVLAGSSSVTPLMQKMKEAYLQVNKNVQIEIQEHDSTAGITGAIEGICDIGMASRELKDSEASEGLTAKVIATDGIAVIVNKENEKGELTSEQVKNIYLGEITKWSELS